MTRGGKKKQNKKPHKNKPMTLSFHPKKCFFVKAKIFPGKTLERHSYRSLAEMKHILVLQRGHRSWGIILMMSTDAGQKTRNDGRLIKTERRHQKDWSHLKEEREKEAESNHITTYSRALQAKWPMAAHPIDCTGLDHGLPQAMETPAVAAAG